MTLCLALGLTLRTILPLEGALTLWPFAAIVDRPARLFATLRAVLEVDLIALAGVAISFDQIRIIVVAIVEILASSSTLFVEPRPGFAQNAEIMFGELQIIFGLDTIAGKLRIARHTLVFFKQLSSVSALAIVLAIAIGPATDPLGTLSTTAATAAALTIVDQRVFPCRSGAPRRSCPSARVLPRSSKPALQATASDLPQAP